MFNMTTTRTVLGKGVARFGPQARFGPGTFRPGARFGPHPKAGRNVPATSGPKHAGASARGIRLD